MLPTEVCFSCCSAHPIVQSGEIFPEGRRDQYLIGPTRGCPTARSRVSREAGPNHEWLAGAGGIEPPNGKIKIRLIIQCLQVAFEKTLEMPSIAVVLESFDARHLGLS
jgi:hypothetical protein